MLSPALRYIVFATALLGALPGQRALDEPGIRDGNHAQACPPSIDWWDTHIEMVTTAAWDSSTEAAL